FFISTSTSVIYTLSLHDALPISNVVGVLNKPFTSDLLLKVVEQPLPKIATEEGAEPETAPESAMSSEFTNVIGGEVESPVSSSPDRKSTRLNSSHLGISYAVFCL